MKITAITPCLASTRDFIRMLDASAYRHGIELRPFGIGKPFVDWRHMLMEHTVPVMKGLAGAGLTHVLYVDGRDSVFMCGMEEIVEKYQALGAPPCLMSHDDPIPRDTRVNAGGWLAEIEFMVATWETLAATHGDDGDYQNWLWRAWPVAGIACDTGCQVFQSIDEGIGIASNRGRFVNVVTGSQPCVLHFRGGYADPVNGREHRIRPVMEALGI